MGEGVGGGGWNSKGETSEGPGSGWENGAPADELVHPGFQGFPLDAQNLHRAGAGVQAAFSGFSQIGPERSQRRHTTALEAIDDILPAAGEIRLVQPTFREALQRPPEEEYGLMLLTRDGSSGDRQRFVYPIVLAPMNEDGDPRPISLSGLWVH